MAEIAQIKITSPSVTTKWIQNDSPSSKKNISLRDINSRLQNSKSRITDSKGQTFSSRIENLSSSQQFSQTNFSDARLNLSPNHHRAAKIQSENQKTLKKIINKSESQTSLVFFTQRNIMTSHRVSTDFQQQTDRVQVAPFQVHPLTTTSTEFNNKANRAHSQKYIPSSAAATASGTTIEENWPSQRPQIQNATLQDKRKQQMEVAIALTQLIKTHEDNNRKLTYKTSHLVLKLLDALCKSDNLYGQQMNICYKIMHQMIFCQDGSMQTLVHQTAADTEGKEEKQYSVYTYFHIARVLKRRVDKMNKNIQKVQIDSQKIINSQKERIEHLESSLAAVSQQHQNEKVSIVESTKSQIDELQKQVL